MPRKSVKSLSFKKRRRPSRKKIQSLFRRRVPRPLTYSNNIGLGKSRKVALTYYEQVGLTSTSGIVSTHTFNLASLFDPDVTGVGHQPFGLDQFANYYRQYYVTSALISVKWTQIASNNIPHKCFVMLDKDNSVTTNLDTRMERSKGASTKTLLVNTNNSQVTKLRYSARRFHSIKNDADDHQIKALLTASPTLPAYAVIGIQPIDSVSSSTAAVYGEVMITYNAVLFDPVDVAGS